MVASKDLLLYLVFTVWFIIEDRNGFGGDFPEINPGSESGTRLFGWVCGVFSTYRIEIFNLAVVMVRLILRL
jgi:hypothetical protein